MKRLFELLLLILLTALLSCQEQAIDPAVRVRPVSLRINVTGTQYDLSWQQVRIVCFAGPCPDVADVEAEKYEVQIAGSEFGQFRRYETLNPDKKSISIPAAHVGNQLVVRIVSKHEGALPANSNLVMASTVPIITSTGFAGYGTSGDIFGGDITSNGAKSAYSVFVQEASGVYSTLLYVADLINDIVVNTKLITRLGGGATFSPDGRQLAYPSRTENGLVIYDIGSETTRILPVTDVTWIWSVDWSPDGKWLAYSTVSNEESRLWKISTSGGQAIPLTPILPVRESNYIRQSTIHWTPDSRFISISRARVDSPGKNWRSVISLYSPDGSGEIRYFDTQPGWIDTNPSFSPDGKRLAFLSTRTDNGSSFSLWTRDLTTNQVQQIRLPAGQQLSYDYAPHWIGINRLVYTTSEQGRKSYFTVTL